MFGTPSDFKPAKFCFAWEQMQRDEDSSQPRRISQYEIQITARSVGGKTMARRDANQAHGSRGFPIRGGSRTPAPSRV